MIKALIFSKDRPLQLRAYLESLGFCTGLEYEKMAIILPKEDGYEQLIQMFPDISWFYEWWPGGFDSALRHLANNWLKNNDYVLFGCDDVVWLRQVNLKIIPDFLQQNPQTIGFSLRLGLNIDPKPNKQQGLFLKWNWTGSPSHWGYPFELMASVYSVGLVKEIINSNKNEMKCPNHLESYGVTYCINTKYEILPTMAMFNTPNYAVAQDVNRVQNYFQNTFTGTVEQDSDHLNELYQNGKVIDWQSMYGIEPSNVFVGNSYFKVH